MARTGNFGRAPRAAPSLTATLVAIAREQENQRDSNIMSAWEKGGLFEGKKVTDSLVLKHWRDRLVGIDKADPLYDTYKNAVTQMEYSIAESKMTASYATKHKTDGQMVAFYMKWAKKVPKDSELYRVLQRDAGQYMRNQRARSQADLNAAKEKAYYNRIGQIEKGTHAGNKVLSILENFATKGYTNPSGTGAIAAPTGLGSGGTSEGALYNLGPEDADEMLQMLTNLLTPKVGDNGKDRMYGAQGLTAETLYHDDNGRPVTGQTLGAYFKKIGAAGYNGTINLEFIQTSLAKSKKTVQELLDLSLKTGHATDARRYQQQLEGLTATTRLVNAIPVQQDYNEVIATYNQRINQPGTTDADILEADSWKTQQLLKLGNDPRIATDDARRSALIAEANKSPAALTLSESFTQYEDRDGEPAKANAANAQRVEYATDAVAGVADGSFEWTVGVRNADGSFTPKAGGNAIGPAATGWTQQHNPAGVQFAVIPQANGAAIKVAVPAQEVTAYALDRVTGDKVSSTGSSTVMKVYSVPYSGTNHQAFGVNFDGKEVLTNDFNVDGAHLQQDSDGNWAMDVSDLLPEKPIAGKGVQVGAPTTDKFGNVSTPYQVDFKQLLAAADPEGPAAGQPDPHTTFSSLTIALNIDSAEGRENLTRFRNDPVFIDVMGLDVERASGVVRDPMTGQVVKDGDPASAQRAIAEITEATAIGASPAAFAARNELKDRAWDRSPATLKPLPTPAATATPFGVAPAGSTASKLPAEALRQLNEWKPLTDRLDAGNNYVPQAIQKVNTPSIRLGKDITIPGVQYTPPTVPQGGSATYAPPAATGGANVTAPSAPSAPGGAYKPPASTYSDRRL